MARRMISCVCLSALAAFGMASPFAQQPTAPTRATNPAAAAPQPPVARSLEIHPDKTVTFRLAAPQAAEVTLNGSWDGAVNIRMTKDEGGVWSATVGPLGALVTATSTLRERAEPYNLLLELARGKLNQVRSQSAEWIEDGLPTPLGLELREDQS